MVKISEAVDASFRILKGHISSPRAEAELLTQYILKKDKIGLIIAKNEEVSDEAFDRIKNISHKRACGMPISYITGKKEFMSLEFTVNENVLIPRPETEELVSLIIERYKEKEIKILDLCTGSGAICCSLAYYLKKAICAGADISSNALDVAQTNAKNLNLVDRVSFFRHDVLNPADIKEKYDIVVSNPPYIETDTINKLDNTVKTYEPRIALDGGNDGLDFYKKIISNIGLYLKNGGMIFFEIGYNQGETVSNLFDKKFDDIEVIKDLSGHNRIVTARYI